MDQPIIDAATRFAEQHVAPVAEKLISEPRVPDHIWQAAVDAGLTAIGLDDAAPAADPALIYELGRIITEIGQVPGLANAIIGHVVISNSVSRHAFNDQQMAHWMPRLARGEARTCIAISEPGAGGHPKRLTTRADKTDTGWALTGEKAYLTSGPDAAFFIVLAITDIVDGRKKFGAFLVPEDTPGIERTEGVKIDFLKPSSHCGLKMEGAILPPEALLERAGDPYETILKRFRRVEDCQMQGIVVGGCRAALRRLAQRPDAPADWAQTIGALSADIDLLDSAARQLIQDSGGDPTGEFEPRLLAIRAFGRRIQEQLTALVGDGMQSSPFILTLVRDMTQMGRIAMSVDQAKLTGIGKNIIGEQNS